MQKRFIKYIILSFGLILNNHYLEAKKVSGFIITENSDTIYGEIKISKFNLLTAGLILDGINVEPLHFEVWFRNHENRKFNNFQAKDILGFGFNYKSMDYLFHSFTLESNSCFKEEKKRDRFLQLCYAGKVSLYKDLSRMNNHNNSAYNTLKIGYDQSFLYYDFFLFNEIKGLKKVEISKDIKTIYDLLYLYDFEKEFLERIPKDIKLKDIKIILMKYELWLYENESWKIKI